MEETRDVKVSLNGILGFGDPSPVLTLIFATLCFCFWANTMGFFTDGAVLAIGILQLGVLFFYYHRELAEAGNIWYNKGQ